MEAISKSSVKCLNCGDYKIETFRQGGVARARFCSQCFQYCSQCEGSGFVLKKDSQGRDTVSECDCREIRKRVTYFNNANIPGIFHDATLDNFEIYGSQSLKDALNMAKFSLKNYQQGNKKGLLFMGGVGVGKTRLISGMLREYILRYGVPGLFQEFSNLLSEIKAGYDQGLSERTVLSKVSDIEVLVIDELGKGRKSDWEIAILDSIISSRYNMDKVTICATNYTNDKNTTYVDFLKLKEGEERDGENVNRQILEERIHSRIYSRLREMCYFKEIKADDRRSLSGGRRA